MLPQTDVQREKYKDQRKPAPVNAPLSRTVTWAASLPSDIRPNALLRRYARIANVIAATWPDPKAFDMYIDSLVNDRRGGGRQGFPLDVLGELTALALHHSERRRRK